jgi:hypothetical protein
MKLPIIKNLVEFIDENDQDFVLEAIEVLEHISQAKGLKDEELNTIGELLSNMYGAVEVSIEIHSGTSQKDALNGFMKRVLGSIDS